MANKKLVAGVHFTLFKKGLPNSTYDDRMGNPPSRGGNDIPGQPTNPLLKAQFRVAMNKYSTLVDELSDSRQAAFCWVELNNWMYMQGI